MIDILYIFYSTIFQVYGKMNTHMRALSRFMQSAIQIRSIPLHSTIVPANLKPNANILAHHNPDIKNVRSISTFNIQTMNDKTLKNGLFSKFLAPIKKIDAYQPQRGMKLVQDPKRRCKHCYIVIEDEMKYVFCDKFPRHKQKQIQDRSKLKVHRILTHATQGGRKSSAKMGMWTQQGLREDY